LTHFLTVRDVARSRDFYADILGGRVVLQENPAIVKVATAGSS
jgi:catechol 2,3-dioxygenase-like lactoylglutathione lyase family enzyme